MDAWFGRVLKHMLPESSAKGPCVDVVEAKLGSPMGDNAARMADFTRHCKSDTGSATSTSCSRVQVLEMNTSADKSVLSMAANVQQSHRQQSNQRIAHWDKKREKCYNCRMVYLKTLSLHPGYCSVDCKSNAVYLDKVNRTIRAVKNAVDRQQKQKQQQEEEANVVTNETASSEESVVATENESHEEDDLECEISSSVPRPVHTFAEFGLEARILDQTSVEWAFSAMY